MQTETYPYVYIYIHKYFTIKWTKDITKVENNTKKATVVDFIVRELHNNNQSHI